MKKTVYLLLAFCFAALFSFAQNQQIVLKFDTQAKDTVISIDNARLSVLKTVTDSQKHCEITIEIANTDPAEFIYLFDRLYPEQELKNDYVPKIVFSDSYHGKKGSRLDECCKNINKIYCIDPGTRSYPPIKITLSENEEKKLYLPIYFATKKGWLSKKHVIYKKATVDIDLLLFAEPKKENDYLRLDHALDSLIEDLTNNQFCKHPAHQPPLKQQEDEFLNKLRPIESEIDDKLRQLPLSSTEYADYKKLKDRINLIDLTEYVVSNCGHPEKHTNTSRADKPSKPVHHCKYCDWTLDQMCQQLNNYYVQLDNKKITKDAIKKDVDMIYTCCKSPSHSVEWKKGQNKENIERLYKLINNF